MDPGAAGGQIAHKSGLGNARRKQDLDDRGLTKLLQFVVTSERAPRNKQHKLLGLLAVLKPHGLNASRAAGCAGILVFRLAGLLNTCSPNWTNWPCLGEEDIRKRIYGYAGNIEPQKMYLQITGM